MAWTLPNILTVFRLFAALVVPALFFVIAHPYADWIALIVFLLAGISDFFDGYLARRWQQESRFGAMLDPIADKAMVAIALLTLIALTGLDPWLVLPAVVILFREVFVSGLREYLGDASKTLKVTKLAKWKTTIQMFALAILFAKGIVFTYYIGSTAGMDDTMAEAVLAGEIEDITGLRFYAWLNDWIRDAGHYLLALAALLTFITGLDYYRKALPFLRGEQS